MPVYQANKSGIGCQAVCITPPADAVVFAVTCQLLSDCDAVRVCVPDGFHLVDASVGTGRLLPLTKQVWKTKVNVIQRAELFCVARSLAADGGRNRLCVRLPYDTQVDGQPIRVGMEIEAEVEVGVPTTVCQLCRGREVVPFFCKGDLSVASVEAIVMEAMRLAGQALFSERIGRSCTSQELQEALGETACREAADALVRTLYDVGFTVKRCAITPAEQLGRFKSH